MRSWSHPVPQDPALSVQLWCFLCGAPGPGIRHVWLVSCQETRRSVLKATFLHPHPIYPLPSTHTSITHPHLLGLLPIIPSVYQPMPQHCQLSTHPSRQPPSHPPVHQHTYDLVMYLPIFAAIHLSSLQCIHNSAHTFSNPEPAHAPHTCQQVHHSPSHPPTTQ